jgi:hypothetical protein
VYGALKAGDEIYNTNAQATLDKTALMQTLLLIFLFLTAAAIVLFLFRPFQARIREEMTLVANALSQLPLDVDVETMVVQAVMSAKGAIDAATAEEFGLAGANTGMRRRTVELGRAGTTRGTRDSLPVVPAVGGGGDYSSEHSSGF